MSVDPTSNSALDTPPPRQAGEGVDAGADAVGVGSHDDAAESADVDLAGLGIAGLPLVLRAILVLAPLGLLITVVCSVWLLQMRVGRSVLVQVDPTLVPGRPAALRASVLGSDQHPIPGVEVDLEYAQDGGWAPWLHLDAVYDTGVAQGTAPAPSAGQGALPIRATFHVPGARDLVEEFEVTLASELPLREGTHTYSTSTINHGDDTSPQPEGWRIDARVFGRVLSSFDNELLVRVSAPDGTPWRGPIEIWLVDGEFGGHRLVEGSGHAPERLFRGETDRFGLASTTDQLSSMLMRFEVRIFPPATAPADLDPAVHAPRDPAAPPDTAPPPEPTPPPEPAPPADPASPDPGPPESAPPQPAAPAPITRRFRMVSFSGATTLAVQPLFPAAKVDDVTVRALTLRGKRPVFIDVHDETGAWVTTIPPALGRMVDHALDPALWEGRTRVQLEAYGYVTRPGEDTSVAVIYPRPRADEDAADRLAPAFADQRARLDMPRPERHFDKTHERAWLDRVEQLCRGASDTELLGRWLTGTQPLRVHGPPVHFMTRAREEDRVVATKVAWTRGLRWFVVIGGTALLVAAVWSLRKAAADMRARARAVLGDGSELEMLQRQQWVRGAFMVGLLAVSMALGFALLESLIWVE